ncbi:nucleotidyltransferase domain-containing protein [Bacillus testis]|uniref:nucleotidyltransferase domain-containing protein n=1 Tax=Bacillus testis TaxID=1622072 RepID=UPI00067EA389|nr:nucleotidyltransferase domain-containing protein [Bacillus testis]
MRGTIQEELAILEKKHDIKILYACESGSRSWGYHSQDSDYDVRFLYIHRQDDYLSIDPVGIGRKRDAIEVKSEHKLDVAGWEITKALRLFRKGNASLLEWLHTENIYRSPSPSIIRLKELSNKNFHPLACFHHYLNMASRNYREWQDIENVKLKAVLNTIRPALAARWIESRHTFPPLLLQTLLEQAEIEQSLQDEMGGLLARKTAGERLALQQQLVHIRRYLNTELPSLHEVAGRMPADPIIPTEVLDCLFRQALKEAWE